MYIPLDTVMQEWARRTSPWYAASELWAAGFRVWCAHNQLVMAVMYAPMIEAMRNATEGGRGPAR